uniref:Uncharacterized protein n=1 Tax=Setaria italica TaxID=4555 RepID=K3YFD0_SETIT
MRTQSKRRPLLQKSDFAWKLRPQTLKSCDSDFQVATHPFLINY